MPNDKLLRAIMAGYFAAIAFAVVPAHGQGLSYLANQVVARTGRVPKFINNVVETITVQTNEVVVPKSAVAKATGGLSAHTVKADAGDGYYTVLSFKSAAEAKAALATLKANHVVAQPNAVIHVSFHPTGASSVPSSVFSMDFVPALKTANAPRDTTSLGAGQIAADIDTGCNLTNPFFNGRVVGKWNFILGNKKVPDNIGHGDLVCSTMLELAGASKIYEYKVFSDSGDTDIAKIASAMHKAADDGAQFLCMPLGEDGNPGDQPVLDDAANYVTGLGAIVVASDGNESSNRSHFIPAGLSTNGVVGISATNERGERSFYSNYGSTTAACGDAYGALFKGYGFAQGTSFSAPAYVGIAMAVAAKRGLSPFKTVERISRTANPAGVEWANQGLGLADLSAALGNFKTSGLLGQALDVAAGTLAEQNIGNVTVTATDANNVVTTFKTDASGQFAFPLRPGAYTIQASKKGYLSYTLPAQVNVKQNGLTPIPLLLMVPVIDPTSTLVVIHHKSVDVLLSDDLTASPFGTLFVSFLSPFEFTDPSTEPATDVRDELDDAIPVTTYIVPATSPQMNIEVDNFYLRDFFFGFFGYGTSFGDAGAEVDIVRNGVVTTIDAPANAAGDQPDYPIWNVANIDPATGKVTKINSILSFGP